MSNAWNLGNTTIRNPNRIELGLKVFADEFQGNVYGKEHEALFAKRLNGEGIIVCENNADFFGRKWRSAFVKLGFATDKEYKIADEKISSSELAKKIPTIGLNGYKYELTPVGNNLLKADSTAAVHDVFLRQLLCHEIPSPIPTESRKNNRFSKGQMKPFVYLLQVLKKLDERGEKGLNKIEVAAFLQIFINHTNEEVEKTVEKILKYRNYRINISGSTNKKRFDKAQLDKAVALENIKGDSLKDYADTTFRYAKMTGLLTHSGSRLILRENKMDFVEGILSREPIFLGDKDPLEYLNAFYTGMPLPTDNIVFANQEIQHLSKELQKYSPSATIPTISPNADISEIERIRYRLLEDISWAREIDYATNQEKEESIKETIDYLSSLDAGKRKSKLEIIDRPAYLEWAVWRGFLAIDHITSPIHETRRFPVDEDFFPRHTAPGGGSDLIFEYEDYILVVEVTLTTSSRQVAAEGEPVRRHVADIKEKSGGKEVYGIFIAPQIDNNTAETFRNGLWYVANHADNINVVPFTLKQFSNILELLIQNKYTPVEIQRLLDRCLIHRNANAPQWVELVETETEKWIKKLN